MLKFDNVGHRGTSSVEHAENDARVLMSSPSSPVKISTDDYSQNYGGVDVIINDTRKNYVGLRKVNFCSVKGYALYNKQDPEEAIQRAITNGHSLIWITVNATVMTSSKGYYEAEAARWDKAPVLSVGDIVEFEGRVCQIAEDHNGNFKFKEIK